ncbi:MAG: hypothetical protein HOI95_17650 [Chromatiales bacterium]|jgi:hypothetical protein|nr:hypothetical protein [Chromatiales bacterium]MBT6348042.1 hypothetical protein [Pseudomonadota bacterium]
MRAKAGLRSLPDFLAIPLFVVALLFAVVPPGHAQEETQTEETQTVAEEVASDLVTSTSEESAIPGNRDSAVIQSWLIVVAVVATITTLVAVAVSFFLYRWRRILLAEHPNALVPEEWGAALKGSSKATRKLISVTNKAMRNLISVTSQNSQSVSEHLQQHSESLRQMTDTFMTFKRALDEKDAEIERLRTGYDAHVYRQFLNRFIRVHQSLLECASEEDISVSDIGNLTLLLEDAMEESGVAPFEPDVGEDIRGLGDRVAENPKILETDDPAAHLTIAAVNAPGYEIVSGEKPDVLAPAQVTVYRSSNIGEEA